MTDSSLVMDDISVVFGNNKKFSPNVRQTFDENSRTRAIDLPGNARKIKRISFRYGNLPGGGRAKVQVWGKAGKVVSRPPPRPRPPTYEPQAPRWNNTGWTKLGERWVNGRKDRDIINLRNRGAFTHLTVVVSDSDLEMFELTVTFGNGKTYSPNLRHTFKNGSRSRAINLPGHRRNIKKVEFKYGNIAGRPRAKVGLWGIDRSPKIEAPKWKSTGWTKLGEKWVNGNRDRDTFNLRNKGAWTHLTVVVSESDLSMQDMKVTFGNNQVFDPKLRHVFKNGSRSRAIDLPGHRRNIKNIKFAYGNLPGSGRAKVAVYGMNRAPKPTAPKWKPAGWTKLGERWVNGRRDRDVFKLSNRGAYTHLTLVVSESDLRMFDMQIVFGNGQKHSPNLKHVFKNGARSRAINLPGHARNIKTVSFKYGNLPGTGRAKVTIYGKSSAAKPKPPKWRPAGWTKLGERWVNGRRDRDTFNLKNKGAYTHLTLVVSESDLRMFDMQIVFGNGQKHSPNLKHVFKNGARSRAINLPGHARNIKTVSFKYGNLPGTGRAKVTIYGKSSAAKPKPPKWRPAGWTKLGERWVNGRRDRDTFNLKNKGAYTHLTLVVSESDLRMFDMQIVFGNGQKHSPNLKHVFKNGARSRAINLPGHARNIKTVSFKYGNLPGTGRAKVTIYGKSSAAKPKPPKWKPAGWTKLGEKWVNGRRDRDVIAVGRKRGAFSAITIVVSDSDLRLDNLVVTFGNKQKFSPKLRHVFKNGSRSRKIDLPGNVRNIQKIAFKYGNLPGTGRAKVAIWAKPGGNTPTDKPAGWTSKGWSKLGTRVVQGRRDADSINVGTYAKAWNSIAFEVKGGDVIVRDIVVTFGNGDTWSPKVRHVFKDGSRSRAIKLPKKRKVKKISFVYGKKKRRGKAKVNIWAQ